MRARRPSLDQLYLPLAVLVAIGVVVRVATMLTYSTAAFAWQDSLRFLRIAPYAPETGLFDDPWMPAGYPMFQNALRAVTDQLWFTIGVQHLIGVLTALALFAALRRLGCPRGVALAPAALVLLSGDWVYAEHSLMTEALSAASLALGLLLVVLASRRPERLAWFVAAGVALAAAALVRNVGLVAIPISALWLVLVLPGPWRRRIVPAATLAGVAMAVLAAYAAVATSSRRYAGMSDLTGWFQYGRTAPFAQCAEFDPERPVAVLCERTPPEQRLGPFHYVNDTDNPARQNFDLLPWACALKQPGRACASSDQDELRSFAMGAILGQPTDYARAVAKDLARYVDPQIGVDRERWGSVPEQSRFGAEDPSVQPEIARLTATKYDGVRADRGSFAWLETYQRVFHVGGLGVLVAAALALAGMAFGRGRPRAGAALFGLTALAMYAVPVLTFSYDARYGLPGQPLLVAAAALGAWALAERHRGRAHASPADAEPRLARHLGAPAPRTERAAPVQ